MHDLKIRWPILLALAWPAGGVAQLTPEQLQQLPAPASRQVDFSRDIKPIVEASCVKCHGRGKAKGGFQLDTRQTFLKDADSGPAVVVGESARSHLIHLVSGLDPDIVMPQKGSRLTSEQVGLLRAWIDQGLAWDPAVSFAREPHRNLTPRRPQLPPASAPVSHPVDQFVWDYFARHKIVPREPVNDHVFARRVFLDVIGLPPTPEELDAFLRESRTDKREQLVKTLLADQPRYAQHWLTFWNDLLRNDYRGTGYIDGGREQITQWLYAALRDNKPYNRFVRELVNPGDGGPAGFTRGIVWRGAVNASQTPQMQAGQNISQVFLGVNLKCASCHDSFIDDWQLADAYGMAGVYADEKLELVLCDRPLGQHVRVKFLFPELGEIDDNASKAARVERLAELVTSPDNGRLSRTIVNRLWARFLGRGLVEPLDVMQNPAWHPDLLDWLAEELVASGWDLKRTMALVLTSRAYQLPSLDTPEREGKPHPNFVFRGPVIRRLTAEQFRDALGQLTGVWTARPEGNLQRELSLGLGLQPPPAQAFWIWSDPHAVEGVAPGSVPFRKAFSLPDAPTEAVVWVNVDDDARLFVNGTLAPFNAKPGWNYFVRADIKAQLRAGENLIAVEATNGGTDKNAAGLLLYAKIRAGNQVLDLATDASWLTSGDPQEHWRLPDLGRDAWKPASVLGDANLAPWRAGEVLAAAVAGHGGFEPNTRASLAAADALAIALGRPSREQVASSRLYTATTIQALELTNGGTLARVLKEGAQRLAEDAPTGEALVNRVFRAGLGRSPTAAESELCLALVGQRPEPAGIEDLLWSVSMLPEFQLIL